ncbi:MAG TPA: CRISPR-associated protein Csx3 [Ktedonobacteraceae bacterium]
MQPAVLIGGPPHAGKSVLTYSLTRALRTYGVEHYVMRACPDGEGHWSQETLRQVAEAIRQKGVYTDEFVRRVCADIQRRRIPFLIDVGGLPQGDQFQIFQCCTHAILLQHRVPSQRDWQSIVAEYRLELVADLISDLDGVPTLDACEPIVRGTLVGLHRGTTTRDEPFESLVRRLISLFNAPTIRMLSKVYAAQARTEQVLNLPQILNLLAPGQLDWTPAILPRLLAEVPARLPLSVYGRAAHWVCTALALHIHPATFYQFDARLGWLAPLCLQIGLAAHPDISFRLEQREDFMLLDVHLCTANLDYDQLRDLNAPRLPVQQGLVISGKLPLWLASSLAISYRESGLPWIAGYYPQSQGAIVVFSRVPTHRPGDCIALTLKNEKDG